MKLNSFFVDQIELIPIEVLWETLDDGQRSLAYQMFEHENLHCKGRSVIIDGNPYDTDLGKVFDIPVEVWRDADESPWYKWNTLEDKKRKLTLHGLHSDDVFAEIQVVNTARLREFVGYDMPSLSIEEYDDRFFKSTNTKMGAKVWARAAAALASGHVEPTGGKLTSYLLGQQDIWPKGEITEDQLKKHLSLFVIEFKRLSNP